MEDSPEARFDPAEALHVCHRLAGERVVDGETARDATVAGPHGGLYHAAIVVGKHGEDLGEKAGAVVADQLQRRELFPAGVGSPALGIPRIERLDFYSKSKTSKSDRERWNFQTKRTRSKPARGTRARSRR